MLLITDFFFFSLQRSAIFLITLFTATRADVSHLFNNEVKESAGYGYSYPKPQVPLELPTTTKKSTCPPGTVLKPNGECKSEGYK